jgi:hypothetical protein
LKHMTRSQVYLESPAKCTEFTLLMCPLKIFFVASLHFGAAPMSPHLSAIVQSAIFCWSSCC